MYVTNIPNTACELFDGELVIAHYGSGLYYAVSESGALIWQGLRHGLSDVEVQDWLAGHYVAQANEIGSIVATFIDRMQQEGLLVSAASLPRGPDLPPLSGAKLEIPKIERFDDLQDLLLVDPVHDVDSTGWPRVADDSPR